jgi:hypothetical protein
MCFSADGRCQPDPLRRMILQAGYKIAATVCQNLNETLKTG